MKQHKNKIIIGIIVLITLVLALILIIFISNKDENSSPEQSVILDAIDKYEYKLEDRDGILFKNKFDQLKKLVNEEHIDYESYAKIISELYVIDLYTIENKTNKYDVGGMEFLHPDIRENFSLKVQDTIYKTVEDNTNGKRTQNLPEVISTEITEYKVDTFKIGEIDKEAYFVTLEWTYEADLGYDGKATIVLVNENDILYIVEQK